MRGWAELLLCASVQVASWVRTPVGALGAGVGRWVQGEPADLDLLASFRTTLPARLDAALEDALAAAPPPHDPPTGWSPSVDLAVQAHLGADAHAEIAGLKIEDPAVAIEVWAVGPDLRRRAIDRARAAGARDPASLAAHASYLPEREARAAQAAVADTLALATVLDLAWPVDPTARVSSGFGPRHHPTLKRTKMHEGVDIAVPIGTPVHAAGPGRVVRARDDRVNGRHVILDHGHRVRTAYCHGDALHVEKGAQVAQGDPILDSGNSGRSTGPHLHFGLRIGGRPVDPAPFRARSAAGRAAQRASDSDAPSGPPAGSG